MNRKELEDAIVKKCEEIVVLIKVAKMTLTEINTLTNTERGILAKYFLESAQKESELMKQKK